jgi:hypothetical protein
MGYLGDHLQRGNELLAHVLEWRAADLYTQKLSRQQLLFVETQGKRSHLQAQQPTELGPVAAVLHIRQQRRAGAGGVQGTQ